MQNMLGNLVLSNDMVGSCLPLHLPCLPQSGCCKSQQARKLSNKNWSGDSRHLYSLYYAEAPPDSPAKGCYQRMLSKEIGLSSPFNSTKSLTLQYSRDYVGSLDLKSMLVQHSTPLSPHRGSFRQGLVKCQDVHTCSLVTKTPSLCSMNRRQVRNRNMVLFLLPFRKVLMEAQQRA